MALCTRVVKALNKSTSMNAPLLFPLTQFASVAILCWQLTYVSYSHVVFVDYDKSLRFYCTIKNALLHLSIRSTLFQPPFLPWMSLFLVCLLRTGVGDTTSGTLIPTSNSAAPQPLNLVFSSPKCWMSWNIVCFMIIILSFKCPVSLSFNDMVQIPLDNAQKLLIIQ